MKRPAQEDQEFSPAPKQRGIGRGVVNVIAQGRARGRLIGF